MARARARKVRVIEHRPDPDVVRLLRRALADAERGDMVSLAFAGELTGGEIVTGFGGQLDIHRMAGTLERLKLRLLGACSE